MSDLDFTKLEQAIENLIEATVSDLKMLLDKRENQIIELIKENAAFQRHFERGQRRIHDLKEEKEFLIMQRDSLKKENARLYKAIMEDD